MKPTVRGRNVAINIYVTIVTQMINETLYISISCYLSLRVVSDSRQDILFWKNKALHVSYCPHISCSSKNNAECSLTHKLNLNEDWSQNRFPIRFLGSRRDTLFLLGSTRCLQMCLCHVVFKSRMCFQEQDWLFQRKQTSPWHVYASA